MADPITAPDVQTPPTPPPDLSAIAPPSQPAPPAPSAPAPQPNPVVSSMPGGKSFTTDESGNVVEAPSGGPSGAKGVLGKILLGALQGAQGGLTAGYVRPGESGAAAGAAAAQKFRDEKEAQAKQQAQISFKNRQEQDEQKLRHNYMLQQTAKLAQDAQYESELHPLTLAAKKAELEEHTATIQGIHQAQLESSIKLREWLGEEGIDVPIPTTDMRQVNPQLPGLVNGSLTPVHSGETGDKNGISIVPTEQLQTPTKTPYTINTYSGAVDPKTHQFIATPKIISPGDINPQTKKPFTDYDVIMAQASAHGQLANLQKQDALAAAKQKVADEHAESGTKQKLEGAQAQEAGAKAGEASAQTELLKKQTAQLGAFTPPTGFVRSPDATKMSAEDLSKDLQSKGVTVPRQISELDAISKYKGNLDVFPTVLRKGVDQMDRQTAANFIRQYINPNFEESQYKNRANYLNEYESSTKGDGVVRRRMNTAINHLGLLGEAAEAVSQHNVQKLNQVANFYNVEVGKSPVVVYNAIASKAAGELAGAIKGGSGSATDQEIDKAMKLFDPKMSPQAQVGNIKAQMHLLDGAKKSIDYGFQSTVKNTPEELGFHTLSPENEGLLNKWTGGGSSLNTQTGQNRVVPAGGTPGHDASGNVIGFKDAQGNWHAF